MSNVYKAWGIFVIVVNILSSIMFTVKNGNNIILDVDYFVIKKDILSLVLILSVYIVLLFAIIEGVICIIADKNKKYMLPAFVLMVIDNIIYVFFNILNFNIDQIAAFSIWTVYRFIMLYSAFEHLRNTWKDKENV